MAPDTLAGRGSDMSVTCFCTKKPSSPVALGHLRLCRRKFKQLLVRPDWLRIKSRGNREAVGLTINSD